MSGFYEGHMAVEFYKGNWILRRASPEDRPVTENKSAAWAMGIWKKINRRKFEALRNAEGSTQWPTG